MHLLLITSTTLNNKCILIGVRTGVAYKAIATPETFFFR